MYSNMEFNIDTLTHIEHIKDNLEKLYKYIAKLEKNGMQDMHFTITSSFITDTMAEFEAICTEYNLEKKNVYSSNYFTTDLCIHKSRNTMMKHIVIHIYSPRINA